MSERDARNIVYELMHGGQRADFDARYPQRPDWQRLVEWLMRGDYAARCAAPELASAG